MHGCQYPRPSGSISSPLSRSIVRHPPAVRQHHHRRHRCNCLLTPTALVAPSTAYWLLSLDPQQDPMGVLLILDYYPLASRRRHRRPCMPPLCNDGRSVVTTATTWEVEVGAAFIGDLIESNLFFINHTDPLTGQHLSCRLVDMPNWAFSYALALYRLYEDGQSDDNDTLNVGEEDPCRGRAAADDSMH